MEDTIAFQIVGLLTLITIGGSIVIALIIKMNLASRNLISGPLEFRFTSLLFYNEKYKKLIAVEKDNKAKKLFITYMILYKVMTSLAVVCLLALIFLSFLEYH
jgi:hypothetical protein